MKLLCLDNDGVESLITIGKIYDAEEFEDGYIIRKLDAGDGISTFLKSRFQKLVEKDLVGIK